MLVMVCGNKRPYSFDEELPPSWSSPEAASSPPHTVVCKKLRLCASPSSCIQHLKSIFPYTDPQLLDGALAESGNDLDSAIRSLNERHCFGLADHNSVSAEVASANVEKDALTNGGDVSKSMLDPSNLPADGADWVNLFVREMMNASSIDDAKTRASRLLEVLLKSISASATKEGAKSFEEEIMMLKQQNNELIRETTMLKRAMTIQHERQKEFESKNQELQHSKQLLSQYQEQLRTLEVNNYALKMHLRLAEQSNPIPGRFHPDVF